MSDESNMASQPVKNSGQGTSVSHGGKAAGAGGDAPAQASGQSGANQNEPALLPPVDVVEDADGITLYADLPGVPKENLTLHLERDNLTIEGLIALDMPQEMQSNVAELGLGRFRRVFALSKELDGEQTSAELNNGVLKLRIPKARQAQPRKISINVA
jgi:HSP20 family protein